MPAESLDEEEWTHERFLCNPATFDILCKQVRVTRLIDWFADWLIDSPIDGLIDWLIDGLMDWLIDWQFRRHEVMDYGRKRPPPGMLSVNNYPAFQIMQQTTVAVPHSVKSTNFVNTMTQLSALSMRSPSATPCDVEMVKLYRKAARAGYIDVEGLAGPDADDAEPSSSSSGTSDPKSSQAFHWVAQPVKKKAARPEKLSTLSTPEEETDAVGEKDASVLNNDVNAGLNKDANELEEGMFWVFSEREVWPRINDCRINASDLHFPKVNASYFTISGIRGSPKMTSARG